MSSKKEMEDIINSKLDCEDEVNDILTKNIDTSQFINKSDSKQKNITVMVVDDDKHQLSSMEEILKKEYKLLLCTRGQSAIECFAKNQKKISAILLDIRLPDMSGFDVFNELKNINTDIPIIFITGYQSTYGNGFEVYKQYRPHGYIIKNHENEIEMIKDTLYNAIESYTAKKELHDQKITDIKQQTMAGLLHDLNNMFMPITMSIETLFLMKEVADIQSMKKGLRDYIRLFNANMKILFMYAKGKNIDIYLNKERPKKIIEDFLDTIKIQLDPEVKLSFENNFEKEINTDKNILCYQILLNIIKNSQEALYRTKNPTISIETHTNNSYCNQYENNHEFEKISENDFILVVKDNGPGIPQKIIDQLFEPYVSFGKKNGSGLGTWMIKNGIDNLNGKLFLDNQIDKGVTYHLKFKQQ